MEPLAAELVSAAPHFKLLFFNITVPNLIVVVLAIAIFFIAAWFRLPRFIEHGRMEKEE